MTDSRESLLLSLTGIEERINAACARAGRRSEEVSLLAVSKKQPLEKLIQYLNLREEAGKKALFGENYVQEWLQKRESLVGDFEAHLIGQLQRNKVRKAVSCFDVIQTVHNKELTSEIQKEAARLGKQQRIYFQVNVSEDKAKSGFLVGDLHGFLKNGMQDFPNLKVEGLMTITKFYENCEDVRPDFVTMKELHSEVLMNCPDCRELSMGMSADYEIAIEEGATIVRVGTALFGERKLA